MKGKADEITGFKAVDDYTVEITLKSPDLSFLNAVTMDFCDVVPKEWVEKWGKQFNRNPLGTGPFVFQKWTPGREIVLTRNPQYWEEGKPYLDTDQLPALVQSTDRAAQAGARRGGRARRRRSRSPTCRACRPTPSGSS